MIEPSDIGTLPCTRLPEAFCPACGQKVNAATAANGEDIAPRAGDLTVCFHCGCITSYDKDMQLVLIPEATLKDPSYSEALVARKKIRSFRGL